MIDNLCLLRRFAIYILALDQARDGAWSVFDYATKELVAYGSFCYDLKSYTYVQAIVAIEELMQSIIAAYDVSAVFLEDIQLRHNVASFKKLAMLQGVLAASLERNEYLYDYISPSQWQSYCGARSRNTKEKKAQLTELPTDKKQSKVLSLQFVRDQYGIETSNDNMSDAICLGHYVIHNYDLKRSVTNE